MPPNSYFCTMGSAHATKLSRSFEYSEILGEKIYVARINNIYLRGGSYVDSVFLHVFQKRVKKNDLIFFHSVFGILFINLLLKKAKKNFFIQGPGKKFCAFLYTSAEKRWVTGGTVFSGPTHLKWKRSTDSWSVWMSLWPVLEDLGKNEFWKNGGILKMKNRFFTLFFDFKDL